MLKPGGGGPAAEILATAACVILVIMDARPVGNIFDEAMRAATNAVKAGPSDFRLPPHAQGAQSREQRALFP